MHKIMFEASYIIFHYFSQPCPSIDKQDGDTALITASTFGHKYVVDLLIDAGSGINMQNEVMNELIYMYIYILQSLSIYSY